MVNIFLAILNDSYALVQVDVNMEYDVEVYMREQIIKQGLPIYKPKTGVQEILNLMNPMYQSWEDRQQASLEKRTYTKKKQLAQFKKAQSKAKKNLIKAINTNGGAQ